MKAQLYNSIYIKSKIRMCLARIYLLKVNNGNTRKACEVCSNLLTLNKQIPDG